MPSFLIKRIDPPEVNEEIEDSLQRIAESTDQNFDKVKKLLYGQLDYVNMRERGIKGDRLEYEAVTADEILAGTVTAEQIASNTIVAGNIASNTITANEIEAGTITADELTVSELSAISADMGEITAGTIDASQANIININAGNITTGTLDAIQVSGIYGSFDSLETSWTSDDYISIEPNRITMYEGGESRIAILLDEIEFRNENGIFQGAIYASSSFLNMYTSASNGIFMTDAGDSIEIETGTLILYNSDITLNDHTLPSGSFSTEDGTVSVSSGLITNLP